MTSGPQIMRRKANVEESITDAEWLDIFIKNNKIVAAKKESLAQQIAAEIGLDLLRNDLLTDGPISQSLTKNAEAKQIVLKDNYIAEMGRQLDRGNVKFQKALFVPDVYLNNSNQYVKDFNKISKLIYDNHLTVESVVAGDEWKDSSLKQFDTAFIEHFRELERKGVYASTGFKSAMARAGVEKAIIDNFNQSGYDKDKLDKDNLTIAESALGKVIYNLYKNMMVKLPQTYQCCYTCTENLGHLKSKLTKLQH